jgi:hypothetical protein
LVVVKPELALVDQIVELLYKKCLIRNIRFRWSLA